MRDQWKDVRDMTVQELSTQHSELLQAAARIQYGSTTETVTRDQAVNRAAALYSELRRRDALRRSAQRLTRA